MILSRNWALLVLLAAPAETRAEPPPPVSAMILEHTQTLEEIQRWKHAQAEEVKAVLIRRLDDLAEDEDAPEQAVVRRVRETVKAGRAPVLAEARGGPALLQQAIVNDMEDRHAVETEAAARMEHVHRDLQSAFKDLAEGFVASGDDPGARAVRDEAMKWDMARVRSTALSLAVKPAAETPDNEVEKPAATGAQPANGDDAAEANLLRLRAPGPSALALRQPLKLAISYRHGSQGRAVIRARPFFRDGVAEGFSGSRTIFGQGAGSVTLEIGSRSPAVLESVLLQMINPEDGTVLVEQQTRLEATWQ